MRSRIVRFIISLAALCALAACEQTRTPQVPEAMRAARVGMLREISNEPPGDYFVGRRYYKRDYKFWGFVRKPGESWASSKLVMLNEKQKLAPDRQMNKIGFDHNYEYKLYGNFSGERVYEPASNGFYPEFMLSGYEVRSISPAPIFRTAAASDPVQRVIGTPF